MPHVYLLTRAYLISQQIMLRLSNRCFGAIHWRSSSDTFDHCTKTEGPLRVISTTKIFFNENYGLMCSQATFFFLFLFPSV